MKYDTPANTNVIDRLKIVGKPVDRIDGPLKTTGMATYAYDLANAFHSFYHAVPVLQNDDEKVKNARLRLVAAAKQVVANALRLLDIQSPDAM